ncbi:hypothetical protein VZT92_003610 [Zoarces viviparus]|uniref:Uncharacterized protein n=1 Tax=Zoarces viviparus TaxID=48416 RepID=A0AAW1FUU4_ZOAVI
MQERSQLFRYEVAIWERSAKPRGERQEPETNSRRRCQLRGNGREGLPVPAGRGKSGPAARMSGWQGGCAAGSGITLHRCANSSSAPVPPPHPLPSLPIARRQGSQMLAKLQRTAHSSTLSLKSDQK